MTPETIILDSESAIKKFEVVCASMTECEYDLNHVVHECFRVIGNGDTGALAAPVDDTVHLSASDEAKLAGAFAGLVFDLRHLCAAMRLLDEHGLINYRPTGWLGHGAIVLSRNDLAGA